MKIIIYGIGGKMGRTLCDCIKKTDDEIVCGVDKFANKNEFPFPVYDSVMQIKEKADVIIDFSVREAIYDYIPYAVANSIPCVIATTGYNEEETALIKSASEKIAIFKTGNMSVGINLLLQLAKIGAKTLGHSANIEIIEQHHNQKVDAPSGTALLLADGIKSVLNDSEYVFGRRGHTGKRTENEIGIHAIRGGSVVGKHEILFMMDGEVITIKHEAESKVVFANGSINAAHYIVTQSPGIYTMENMLL